MGTFSEKTDGSKLYESIESDNVQTYEELLARREKNGLTGEISPNAELGIAIRDYINKFQHDHKGVTKDDCFVVLTKAHLGVDKEGKDEPDIVFSMHGNPNEIIMALAYSLGKDPIIMHVFERAIAFAKARQMKRDLTGIFDGLAQVLGHANAEEWRESFNKNRAEARPDMTTERPPCTNFANQNPDNDASKPTGGAEQERPA